MGGGGSPAPVSKDVDGINATISGFMSSIAAKDSKTAGKYLAASSEDHYDSSVYTLMVSDFGDDIYDPDDNNEYEFTVYASDIIQPTDSIATVKASYQMSGGEPLVITFYLIKENGVWYIETIQTLDHHSYETGSFVTANYFPVKPSTSYTFTPFYNNVVEPYTYTSSFSEETQTIDGKVFYSFVDEYHNEPSSIRAYGAPPFFGDSGQPMAFSMQNDGLWAYSSYTNNGQPYKILEASHAFNSNYSFLVTWSDYYNEVQYTGTCTVNIGSLQSLETGLGNISAVPLTFTTTAMVEGRQESHKWKLWLSYAIGPVGTDEFETSTDAQPIYYERLLKWYNGQDWIENFPVFKTFEVADQNIGTEVNITFSAMGGVTPYGWDIANSTLPSEFSFATDTATLSGMPQTVGSFTFDIMVKDKYLRVASQTYTMEVYPEGSGTPVNGGLSYEILVSGADTISLTDRMPYEKIYTVNPAGAVTIIDGTVEVSPSVTPSPYLDTDTSGQGDYMLSFIPETIGTYNSYVTLITSDEQIHEFQHTLIVEP
jgi:hypothetical protein